MNLILASASPRRIELMKAAGFNPAVFPSNAEEILPINLSPIETTMYLSFIKAKDVRHKNEDFKGLIIGSDTIVVVDDEIMGKPTSKEDARRMIKSIEGRAHKVITGVALINTINNETRLFFDTTLVYVKNMSDDEIEEYISSDEPYDKAGAYGIQGEFGKYIERYDGDYNNVVGFPTKKFKEVYNRFY